MARKKKLKWDDFAPLDANYKRIGDEPEYYPGWLKCPKCNWPMAYYGNGLSDDYFECIICGKKIFTDELSDDDYPETDEKPKCCEACGGPYPSCMTSCKVFDD